MSSVGREIENAIQSMMSVSEEYATLQTKYDEVISELGMLETLHNVSKYIGSDIEPRIVLMFLEDSIRGVFGTARCQVILNDKHRHLCPTTEFYEYFDYDELNETVGEILIIDDLAKEEGIRLELGSLIILRLNVGDYTYGFLVCQWLSALNLSENKILFLKIISTQVSIYLRSAILINRFKELAVMDSLTGIYNRSYFSSIETTTSPNNGESIIMFDIDHFKQINDRNGHQYGDEILIQFANILTEVGAEYEATAFKYGGEEFIVKCSGGEDVAEKIAKKVCARFKSEAGYTVSSGISTIGTSCKIISYEELLKQADDALYVSKQCGRNRTTISTSDIQILKESSSSLSRLISKSFRQYTPTSIIRMKLKGHALVDESRFDKIKGIIQNFIRVYDEAFFTASLDILLILHGDVDMDHFLPRVKDLIFREMPELKYDIFLLDSVFKEVVHHSTRVSELSQILGAEMGVDKETLNQIRMACEWHDVGKICTDPKIYNKNSPLTAAEYEVIKMHSWLSYCIADSHPVMAEFADWVLYHHEDYNGNGYFGLKGDEIPYPAQIISLADKYDALTEKRCYRPAFTWQEALEILESESIKFNAELFNTFKKLVESMMQIQIVEATV